MELANQILPLQDLAILQQRQEQLNKIKPKQNQTIQTLQDTEFVNKIIQNEITKIMDKQKEKESKKCDLTRISLKKVAQKKFSKDFIIDARNKEVIASFVEYFNSEIKQNRGILLAGTVGAGKSLLFNIFQFLTHNFDLTNKFCTYRANELIENFGAYGNEYYLDFLDRTDDQDILIDDLGTEDKEVMHYGNRVDIMSKFLMYRYDLFQVKGKLLHITSNMSFKDDTEIKARYGIRIADRFKEMFTYYSLTGDSRRN